MDLIASSNLSLTAPTLHQAFAEQRHPDLRTVDLRGVAFVDPSGLVATITLVIDALDRGIEVEFIGPESRDPSAYMHRLGLAALLEELGVEHDLQAVNRHNTGDRLLMLKSFAGDDSADELAEQVHRIFIDDPDEAANLYTAVQEIAQNVLDHSEQNEGYIALQQYNGASGREVAFAIGDGGIGLRASLSKSNSVADDRTAITMAATAGVTATGRPNRGQGIGCVVDISARRDGAVHLMSGQARGRFPNSTNRPDVYRVPIGFPGTLAAARLRVA